MEPESGSVAVFLCAGAFGCWEQKHGREFSAAENAMLSPRWLSFGPSTSTPGPVDMVEAVDLYGSDLDTIAEKLNIE
jgi:hypothetical protein